MSDFASDFSPIQIADRSKSRQKHPNGLILLTKLPDQNVQDRAVGDVTVQASNSNGTLLADRLRQALRHAGSQRAVSRKSGISERSLTRFLSGQDVKTSDLVALADACGVPIEWLAAGRGQMIPSDSPAPSTPPEAPKPPPLGLFNIVNVPTLADCFDATRDVFAKQGRESDTEDLVRASLLLYDLLQQKKS